ncbi:MAG: methyltransferase domain-containing protein [Candidatus Peribacteraceae bacterium]|nr:methyltransferase domain-containing protein [Candidatus Peribacteraceae bacterium]
MKKTVARMLKALHLWEFAFRVRRFLCQFLRIDAVRGAVGWARYFLYSTLLRRLKTLQPATSDVIHNTVFHNMKRVRSFYELSAPRSSLLVHPLSSIRVSKSSPILSIGPRTEGELLNLIGYGFHNVRGLDLITYSPWVDAGDMHAMPYKDGQFGIIIMGWVIAYSNDRRKAAEEAVRVVRNGGIIAVGAEYMSRSAEETSAVIGYDLPLTPIQSVAEILGYFGDAVDHVYFSQDPPPGSNKCDVMAIFSVKK